MVDQKSLQNVKLSQENCCFAEFYRKKIDVKKAKKYEIFYSILSSSNITGLAPSGQACLGLSPSFNHGNLAP